MAKLTNDEKKILDSLIDEARELTKLEFRNNTENPVIFDVTFFIKKYKEYVEKISKMKKNGEKRMKKKMSDKCQFCLDNRKQFLIWEYRNKPLCSCCHYEKKIKNAKLIKRVVRTE